MERREFLKKSAFAAGAAGFSGILGGCNESEANGGKSKMNESDRSRDMGGGGGFPRRAYGKQGDKLSIIGFGGIVVMNAEQDHANRAVAKAYERGINYFDVAPTYGDAELKLGPALEPYRKNCFLACKTTERTQEGAAKELKQSLERLRTDYFDLYQLHAITDVKKDVDAAFAKGGCMEVFLEAKKSGQVRHLGFSAHSEEAALEALDRYDFDSILFPVNFGIWHKGNFGSRVVETARKKGASILALKCLCKEKWPENDPLRSTYNKCWYKPIDDPELARLSMEFTLDQGVTALVPPGDERLFELAMDQVRYVKPLGQDEQEKLKQIAAGLNPIFSRA